MTKLLIEHDSISGNIIEKNLMIKSALMDMGFELYKKRYIALKLITLERPYFVIGLDKITIESIVPIINMGGQDLVIPHEAFDRSTVPNEDVKSLFNWRLSDYFEELPISQYLGTDAFAIFMTQEKEAIARKKISCVWRRNHNSVVSLWARTLPTYGKPLNISKAQYFEQMFFNSRPIEYRTPFWMRGK